MNPLQKMRHWFSNLPNKKHHVEFITAILSVPVLLTVVYMNYLSIQEKRNEDTIPTPTQSVVTIIRENDDVPTPTNIPNNEECEPGLGDIEIMTPQDDETISDNPLEIDIKYTPEGFCAVVWSYRINESKWSEYNDRDIVVYNMPSGQKKLLLRVKSIVNGDEETIERNFTYQNNEEVPTPTSTQSPTPTILPDVQAATPTP